VAAAFASPRSAVDAAVAAQRALELPVRMGIATGEAELRDGDYFGTVLNRAARVMAAGHGGQILVADSTAVLLGGIDLVDLEPRRLRDLPIPRWGVSDPCAGAAHRLCAVAGTGYESEEPAARTAARQNAGPGIRILYLPLTRSWLQSGVSSKESSGASGS
jgi:hypothetical protein